MSAEHVTIDPMRVRTMQIIAIALPLGVIIFGVINVVMTREKPAGEPFMAYFGLGFAILMIFMSFVAPPLVAKSATQSLLAGLDIHRKEDHPKIVDALCGVYQTQMIIGIAVLEGAAFLNLATYFQVVHVWTLGVVVVLLLMMLPSFPTAAKVETWVQQKMELMQMEQ